MAGNTNPQTLLGGYINRKGGDRVTGEPAFVLRMEPWSETSLLVDFYTRHHGRILARARGAKRLTSPMRGILSEFSPLLISWNGSGATKTLMKVEWMGGFAPVEGDSLLSAFYLNELLLRLTPREDPEERLFVAYWDALKVLATESAPPAIEAALRTFEFRLLRYAGYGFPAEFRDGFYVLRGEELVYAGASAPESGPYYASDTLKSVVKLDFSNPLSAWAAKSLFRGVIASLLGDRPLNTRRILSELKRL